MEEKYTNAFDSLCDKVVEYFKDLGYTKDHVHIQMKGMSFMSKKVALKGQYNKNKDSLVVTIDIKTIDYCGCRRSI